MGVRVGGRGEAGMSEGVRVGGRDEAGTIVEVAGKGEALGSRATGVGVRAGPQVATHNRQITRYNDFLRTMTVPPCRPDRRVAHGGSVECCRVVNPLWIIAPCLLFGKPISNGPLAPRMPHCSSFLCHQARGRTICPEYWLSVPLFQAPGGQGCRLVGIVGIAGTVGTVGIAGIAGTVGIAGRVKPAVLGGGLGTFVAPAPTHRRAKGGPYPWLSKKGGERES